MESERLLVTVTYHDKEEEEEMVFCKEEEKEEEEMEFCEPSSVWESPSSIMIATDANMNSEKRISSTFPSITFPPTVPFTPPKRNRDRWCRKPQLLKVPNAPIKKRRDPGHPDILERRRKMINYVNARSYGFALLSHDRPLKITRRNLCLDLDRSENDHDYKENNGWWNNVHSSKSKHVLHNKSFFIVVWLFGCLVWGPPSTFFEKSDIVVTW